jgi:TetR/AcrR family transcriptional repressor of nem operon
MSTTSVRGDTKEKIIALATELIETKGYSAFSYQDIADRLGIKKASIHYHFPSKESLGLAVFDAFKKEVDEFIAQYDFEKLSPAEKMHGYFAYHAQLPFDCNKISCIGALTSEWNVLPETLREKMDDFNNWHVGFIASILREGIERKEFCIAGEIEHHALLIIAATKGALLMSREKMSIEIYNAISGQLMENLKCK